MASGFSAMKKGADGFRLFRRRAIKSFNLRLALRSCEPCYQSGVQLFTAALAQRLCC